MKKAIIPIATFIICLAGMSLLTHGFQTFTIFSRTLYNAGTLPREMPHINLIDQDSTPFAVSEKDKYVLLNFMYINCPNACHIVNYKINEIYDDLKENNTFKNLEIVTITFDLKNDNISKIKNYRQNFSPDMTGWTFAIPNGYTRQEFHKILKETGVWAHTVSDTKIINHSLYLFLISPQNQIVHIYDPARDSNNQIINSLKHFTHDRQT